MFLSAVAVGVDHIVRSCVDHIEGRYAQFGARKKANGGVCSLTMGWRVEVGVPCMNLGDFLNTGIK